MKNYIKEVVIIIIQMLLFYVFPVFAGPTDAMGMVVILIFACFVLAFLLGILSKSKVKYLYPIIIAILFIPSVFLYYNESALIHSAWYLVVSAVGLSVGSLINKLTYKEEQ